MGENAFLADGTSSCVTREAGMLLRVKAGEVQPMERVVIQSISSAGGPIYQVLGVLSDSWGWVHGLMLQVAACWVQDSWCTYLHQEKDGLSRMGKGPSCSNRSFKWASAGKLQSTYWQLDRRMKQNIAKYFALGKAFPASMWLCWQFNALSVINTYF